MQAHGDLELRRFHSALSSLQAAFEEMTWNSMYLVGYCKTLEVCDSLHLLLPMEDGFDQLARLVRQMQVTHKRRVLAAAAKARALILDVERILQRIGPPPPSPRPAPHAHLAAGYLKCLQNLKFVIHGDN
ncbi:Protein of unknown function [Gryllus bimaculatus]|nr:Protein of unknown function [Gryllus bimaculatus]